MPMNLHASFEPTPLRVLHIVSGDLWAGAEVQVWQLLRAARQLTGIELKTVVLNSGLLAERLSADDVPVVILEESEKSFLQLAYEIGRMARAWRPNVIHTHRRKEHVLGAIAAKVSNAALAGTVHGRSEAATRVRSLRNRFHDSLERTVLARAHDRVIAVADDLAADLPGGIAHAVVIPNSVDIDIIRSAASATIQTLETGNRIPIGFLGRLVGVKQVDQILQMMTFLENEQPGRYGLHIIGDGPLLNSLQAIARRLEIENVVVFYGFQPDPLPLLSRLRLLVFASAHEGLPMTALEALALGVPIVSPPLASLARLIRESKVGRVAESAAPRHLADAVRALELEPNNLPCPRRSVLPPRYQINHGLSAAVSLWQALARENASSSR